MFQRPFSCSQTGLGNRLESLYDARQDGLPSGVPAQAPPKSPSRALTYTPAGSSDLQLFSALSSDFVGHVLASGFLSLLTLHAWFSGGRPCPAQQSLTLMGRRRFPGSSHGSPLKEAPAASEKIYAGRPPIASNTRAAPLPLVNACILPSMAALCTPAKRYPYGMLRHYHFVTVRCQRTAPRALNGLRRHHTRALSQHLTWLVCVRAAHLHPGIPASSSDAERTAAGISALAMKWRTRKNLPARWKRPYAACNRVPGAHALINHCFCGCAGTFLLSAGAVLPPRCRHGSRFAA